MENLENINKTILIIDKYSDYLYRKSWGKVLIIWGIILPLVFVSFFQSSQLAVIFNIEIAFFKVIFTSLAIVVGAGLTFSIFVSVSRLTLSKQEEKYVSTFFSRYHGIILCFTRYLSFQLPSLVPEPFNIVAFVLTGGIALIFSYFLLQKVHGSYKELLITGSFLLISTIPLSALSLVDPILTQSITTFVFGFSFISGGLYSMYAAKRILDGNL